MSIPEDVSNAALWAIIVGFVQPLVLEFILQTKWTKQVQAFVAFGFSIVTGALTAYFAGAFNGLGLITTILLVAVVSISSYKGFWKQVAPEFKSKTDVTK